MLRPAAPARTRSRAAKLVVEGISKWYRTGSAHVHALDNVSLEIGNGEFVCLVGPSGCGKSTLLDILAGLSKPDGGRVLADGAPVEGPGPQRQVMFQEPALFPWLTTFGNVMFGLKLRRDLSNRERHAITNDYLALVGLEGFARASIHELSGGMKQRAALARALAPDPQVLLMDEPFAALDAMTRDHLYGDIQRIWAESGKTIVFVTHDVREAVCLGDRVVLMSPRPGRIGREFKIALPRARDINSPRLAELAAEIAAALKEAGRGASAP
ncbi:MAG: sulfonate transport system ATP-binding protein [Alphaproteobacteria bacterium]|jgi:NitT/TauT family transport system ATP-binding protein|nr:sulfonate transport system ATP-binding protein [Alphaproteobacteria bacterium]MEA2988914.1 sulfonate transport system ATP-binding protein [Alphaproteobacteria bacterium]